jgi:hypothetical protein
MGACFLIDYMYFEHPNNWGQHDIID